MGEALLSETLAQLREAVREARLAERRAASSALCPNCGAAMTLAAHDARLHILELAEKWTDEYARDFAARSPQP